jgi:hypothetical protein
MSFIYIYKKVGFQREKAKKVSVGSRGYSEEQLRRRKRRQAVVG